MKITDVEVITFRSVGRERSTRWGYAEPLWGREEPSTQTITRITTDEGVRGHMLGGRKDAMANVKPLLVGEDPLDREKLWNWMYQIVSTSIQGGALPEGQMGVADAALWDLAGQMLDLPVHKIMGGCREKVKAYASTYPNLGKPEDYAEHAIACKKRGYKAYKIHAYIHWDPHAWEPAPGMPAFPKEDVEVCRAVREAVGDDMVLMLDPYGIYTLEESLWVGRELEKLNFYWLEHPMIEQRMEPYRRLTSELDIAILAPEHAPGGIFSRAEWVLQGACDMLRIDQHYGGITGCHKLVGLAQAFGIQCEMHRGGWDNTQILGATSEATCKYYERGLLRPDVDRDIPPSYLKTLSDPMDDDGNVIVPQTPGMGLEYDWDYINENLIEG